MRRLGWIQLPVLLACGLFAAGCGSSEVSHAQTTSPRVEAGIAACTKRIDASVRSAALKDELKKSCTQADSGDGMASPAQKTRREVCRKIVIERVPEGPARRRGLAACAVNTRYP